MKKATQKVWIDSDNKLAPDGDPKAAILFAIEGQLVADVYLEGFTASDVNKYFDVYKPEIQEPLPHAVKPDMTIPGESNIHPEEPEIQPSKTKSKTSKAEKEMKESLDILDEK